MRYTLQRYIWVCRYHTGSFSVTNYQFLGNKLVVSHRETLLRFFPALSLSFCCIYKLLVDKWTVDKVDK